MLSSFLKYDSADAGRDRDGNTFLNFLLQTWDITQVEFETIFSLWLERSRSGKQDPDDDSLAKAARRAIEG